MQSLAGEEPLRPTFSRQRPAKSAPEATEPRAVPLRRRPPPLSPQAAPGSGPVVAGQSAPPPTGRPPAPARRIPQARGRGRPGVTDDVAAGPGRRTRVVWGRGAGGREGVTRGRAPRWPLQRRLVSLRERGARARLRLLAERVPLRGLTGPRGAWRRVPAAQVAK